MANAETREENDEYLRQMSLSTAKAQNIDEMLESYDLNPPPSCDYEDKPEGEILNINEGSREFAEKSDDWTAHQMARAVQHREQATRRGRDDLESVELDEELGKTGTKFWDGRLKIEDNTTYRPYNIRGRSGNPGTLAQQYRDEPMIRDSVDSIVEIQVSADRQVRMPPKTHLPDGVDKGEMKDWMRKLDRVFNNLDAKIPGQDGFQSYIQNAANSSALFGFAPFEVVWQEAPDDIEGVDVVPRQISYREVATVEKWIMDEKQNLVGAEFDPGADEKNVVIPSEGEDLRAHKLQLCRVSARGANWEGVPPARSSEHWVKFKKLLGQVAAAAAQKHGVPKTYIYLSEGFFDAMPNPSQVNDADLQEVVDQIDLTQAVECTVVGLPGGLRAETPSPKGTMPKLEDLMRYCDEMIVKPFSNSASIVGNQATGSYALAEVKDDRFLRSSPAWNRVVMAPINRLIRLMTIEKFGHLPAYPYMGFQLSIMHSTSDIVEGVNSLFAPNQPVTTFPEQVRTFLARQFDLDDDAFDEDGSLPEAMLSTKSGVPQVSGDLTDVAQSQQEGEPTPDDAPDPDGDANEEANPELSEHPEADVLLEQFNANEAQSAMDAAERKLTDRLNSIAEDQRQWFRDRTNNIDDFDQLQRVTRDAIMQFKPEFRAAVKRASRELIIKGAQSIFREFGITPPEAEFAEEDDNLPETPDWMPILDDRTAPVVATAVAATADHIASRNARYMRDQRQNHLNVETDRSIEKLSKSTIGTKIGNRLASDTYNAGRDQVIRTAQDRVELRTGRRDRARAVRSSMLDENVCDPCLKLDFQNGGPTWRVGSEAYFAHFPPQENCKAGRLCRCVIIYMPSDDTVEEMERMAGAAA